VRRSFLPLAVLVLTVSPLFSGEPEKTAEKAEKTDKPAAAEVKDADLMALLIARSAAMKGSTVSLDMGGRSTRARFVSADKNFLAVEIDGKEQPMPWKMVNSASLFQMAQVGAASVDELMTVARYANQTGQDAVAEKALEKAIAADPTRSKEIEALQAELKPAAPKVSAASATGNGSGSSPATGSAPKYAAVPAGPWKCIGPGGGGAMYTPTINPHDPKMGIITCDMSGVYLTKDGGRTWRTIPGLRYGHGVAFGGSANVIFIGSSQQLHRSMDGGATWQGVTLDRQYPMNKCWDVIVDLDDPRFVWAAFGLAGEAGHAVGANVKFLVERSDDGGATFKDASKGFPTGQGMVKKLAIDRSTPAGNRTIYAATTGGFYRSRDAGMNWEKAGGGLPKQDLRDCVTLYDKATNKTTIIVSAEPGGIYRSTDGGTTFTPSGKGLGPGADGADFVVEQLAAAWNDPLTVYAGGTGFAASNDGGNSWRRLYATAQKNAGWMMTFFPWSHEHARGVGCNPKNSKQVWFTGDMQFYISDDGGNTFTEQQSHPMPEGTPRYSFKEQHHKVPKEAPFYFDGGGLEVTFVYQVIPDALRPNVWYGCYADVGSWRTEDGGKSFTYNVGIWNVGIKSEWRNSCYEIACDKRQPGRLFGVFSGKHNLPEPAPEGADRYFIGGLAISEDGGKSWTPQEKCGLPDRPCTSVLLDRRNPEVVFVAIYATGVYRSTDGGKSFASVSGGLGDKPYAWRLRQTPDGTVFLACALGKPGGLWKYDESKVAWSRVDSNPAFADVRDILVSEQKGDEKFIAVAVEGNDGGLFASNDAGASWKKLHAGAMRSVERTPDGKTWFCAGRGGLFRSVDGAATFARVNDFPFANGINDVTLNPRNPAELWVGTPGNGIYRGW